MAVNVGYGDEKTPDRGHQLYFAALIMVILAGLFVFGRLAARWTNRKFGMDDYTIVLSLVCSIVLSITINLAVVHGYGKHKKDMTHTEIMAALKWFYYAQIFYKLVLGFNKISLLSLYLRIFLGKFFKWLCYASLAIVIGWSVGSVFATIFQCVPISAFWDKSVIRPRCIDSDAFWYAYGIINILTDAIILGLPVHEVMKLQLPRREKLGLLLVFLLGAFVCVTSIVRVIAVANSTKNKADTTWSFISRSTWTLLEANTGIICACLPTLKKPITMLFPRIFHGSSKGSSSTRPSRKSHHLGSIPTTSTWVSSDGTIMTSVTAGQSRKGQHAWEWEEDTELESQMHHPRRIMRQTDVVVSHHSENDSPDRSLQYSTPAKEPR